jgi:hypothetical protein
LVNFGVQASAIDMRGNVSLDKIRSNLPSLLGSFDRVSTLYDFYGFKGRGIRSIVQLEADIAALVDQAQSHRFLPYIQQYEFEALLFSVPTKCVEWMQGNEEHVRLMRQAVQQAGSPELVNDRPETSPSHRLLDLFPSYDKKLHGPEIIELAGLAEIRVYCPRFDSWVARLETL